MPKLKVILRLLTPLTCALRRQTSRCHYNLAPGRPSLMGLGGILGIKFAITGDRGSKPLRQTLFIQRSMTFDVGCGFFLG